MGATRTVRTRVGALAVAIAALAALPPVPTTARQQPGSGGDPELGPLIAGEVSYVDGTHVWTDYAYDDRGPNTNVLAGGDAAYPDLPHRGNTADLVQVQLGTGRTGGLEVAVVLGTLVDQHDALIGIGLDTDRDARTGAATLPGGGWTTSAPLGLEHLLLLPTTGAGELRTWDGSELRAVAPVAVAVDRERNVLRAEVDVLPARSGTWNAVAVAGMLDGAGSWVDGGHAIQDLGYVRAEDPTMEVLLSLVEQVPQLGFEPFQDKVQADVLAGRLPPARAIAPVELGTGRTDLAEPRTGLNAFLYHSRLRLPEGVVQEPRQYLGVYQPYAVFVAPNAGPRPPMVVFLHGANQYQNVNPVHFSPTGLVLAGAYQVPAVVIFPNGRDTGWHTALAEQDALDATDDAVRRFGADPDRVVLSGVSSGGMGTFRLAARYPDRWAGGFSIVGGVQSTGPLENLTNLPFRASNGLLDPLVDATVWRESADALAAAGTVDYRIALVLNRSHDGPIAEGNCYFLELLDRPVDRTPARVRYTVVPSAFVVDPAVGLDQRPDGAYWVADLLSRDGARGSIDADSLARDGRVVVRDIARVDQNLLHGADFCGPHPTMRNGNSWQIEGRELAPAPRPHANALDVTLTNLQAATVDLAGAGLDPSAPLTVTVTADGPGVLHLDGAWNGRRLVERDGEPVAAERSEGRLTLPVSAGEATYTIRLV